MLLAKATFDILSQMQALLEQFDESEYAQPLPMIHGNSIGKHTRHVVEFYICLLQGLESGVVDYDARKRDILLETNLLYVKNALENICATIVNKKEDIPISLRICANTIEESVLVNSSYFRELGYNVEHVIHHMALIKIAVEHYFKEVHLPENFGVAYSTLKYQQQACAQ